VRLSAALAGGLLAAASALACARGPKFPPPPRDPSIPSDTAETAALTRAAPLRVENRNVSDVTVYASRGAVRTRLGTVTGSTTANLEVPVSYVNDVGGFQLIVDPVGARGTYTSPTVVVHVGQRVVLSIESTLSRSSIAVY
jgi:hypothetical protein